METKMKKKRRAFVNEDDCVACGCCVKVCPRNAIEIWKGIAAKINLCLLSKLKTLDFTDFCPIFWYNDCKDFDKNKSFFLQFSYRF